MSSTVLNNLKLIVTFLKGRNMNGFFIDWHILSGGKPNQNKAQAKIFFKEMSKLYGDTPNVDLKSPMSQTEM